jgi:hypothetical protein
MNLSLEDIRRVFMINGATKILLKPLAENDRSISGEVSTY